MAIVNKANPLQQSFPSSNPHNCDDEIEIVVPPQDVPRCSNCMNLEEKLRELETKLENLSTF